MMFARLDRDWRNYQEAMQARPYDGIRVQAFGMRFADEWRRLAHDIERFFKLDTDTLEYGMKAKLMPLLCPTWENA
jgi:hypothetical protein